MSVDRFQNVVLTKNAGRDQKRAFGKYLASAAISVTITIFVSDGYFRIGHVVIVWECKYYYLF